MKVFIKGADMASGKDARIIAVYEDDIAIDAKAHGDDAIMLTGVPRTAVKSDINGMMLASDWRQMSDTRQVVSGEATKRIEEVFPSYSQLNTVMEVEQYILKYGTDAAKWPANVKQRKAEIDRCWDYVNAVRSASATMAKASLPVDPTADARWPNKIAPYKAAP